MAREFDVYLTKRLTECDVIVYSIPYRDGITVTNRMILENCLADYILQRFIAVESESDLVSHIDKMIAYCYTVLQNSMEIDTKAEFDKHHIAYPEENRIEMPSEMVDLFFRVYGDVGSTVEINSGDVTATLEINIQPNSTALLVKSEILGDTIFAFLGGSSSMEPSSSVSPSVAKVMETGENKLIIRSSMSFVQRRLRLLEEMDEDELSAYDNMTLDAVDHITI